jgi:type II secretory pathway component PulC
MRHTCWLALVLGGCAVAPRPAPATAAATENAAETAPASAAAATDNRGEGTHTIMRGELVKVLDASPGLFLQHVVTEPQLANGRFVGWRLVSFFPGDARFAGVDLQAGDVVTRVNGHAIEQPDQFMAVWDGLRRESQLVVDVQRNGAARTLRWTIADK